VKTAFITGITGKDGPYLAEFPLARGYAAHSIVRRTSTFNTDRPDHICVDPDIGGLALHLHHGYLGSAERHLRHSDATRAPQFLGWTSEVSFRELMKSKVDDDLESARQELTLAGAGHSVAPRRSVYA